MKKKNHKYTQPAKPGEIDWMGFNSEGVQLHDVARDTNASIGYCLILLKGAITLWSRVPMEVAG